MRDLRVAVVCMQSYYGRTEENLARIESYIRDASSNNAHIICFPELAITGYSIRNDPLPYAQPIPGSISERIVAIARQYKLVVLAGMLEKTEENGIYITQLVAGPRGLIGTYRKTHLSPQEKNSTLQAGDCRPSRIVAVALGCSSATKPISLNLPPLCPFREQRSYSFAMPLPMEALRKKRKAGQGTFRPGHLTTASSLLPATR